MNVQYRYTRWITGLVIIFSIYSFHARGVIEYPARFLFSFTELKQFTCLYYTNLIISDYTVPALSKLPRFLGIFHNCRI